MDNRRQDKMGELLTVQSLYVIFYECILEIWAICPLKAHKTPLKLKMRSKKCPWYSGVPFIKCQILILFQ